MAFFIVSMPHSLSFSSLLLLSMLSSRHLKWLFLIRSMIEFPQTVAVRIEEDSFVKHCINELIRFLTLLCYL